MITGLRISQNSIPGYYGFKLSGYQQETLAYQTRVLADGGVVSDLALVDEDFKLFKGQGLIPYHMVISYGGYLTYSTDYVKKAYALYGLDVRPDVLTDINYMPYYSSSGALNNISSFDYWHQSSGLKVQYAQVLTQPFQVFNVLGASRDGNVGATTNYVFDAVDGTNRVLTYKTSTTNARFWGLGGQYIISTTTAPFATASCYSALASGSTSKIYINGVQDASGQVGSSTNYFGGITIGKRYAQSGAYQSYKGEIYVTIVFTASLTTNQRTSLCQYFGNRFGITIS